MRKVTVVGHEAWEQFQGKSIEFKFCDGWDDWLERQTHAGTRVYHEDPRYPRYYVLDEDGGGVSFYWNEEVEVTVYD